jgi:exodeoxyribonuclease V alpha subunit
MNLIQENKDSLYEKISGIIERITFHNEENGWSVIKVSPFDTPNTQVTVVIHQAQIVAGDSMDFYGSWIMHPKFGKQFKAEKGISKKPASANALEKYLGSGLIFGVGPKTAHKIVKYFGSETLTVFDSEIERLLEVPSIGKSKLQQIKEAWEEHKAIKDVMIFLQSHGISTLYSVKIYKQYGNDAIQIVSLNPYTLAKDIYGIGFFSADKIARSIGFAADSPERIEAGIKHVLDASRENGHCYLTKDQMYKGVKDLLELSDDDLIDEPLIKLLKDKNISMREVETDNPFYYSNSLYWDEIHLSRRLKEIIKFKPDTNVDRVRNWLEKYCERIKMSLSDEQFETVISVSTQPFSIITGGPGCGKTTTTKAIVKLFEAMGKSLLLAAPTGRAAQRMTEVIGREALTIHRLLVWNPKEGKFDKNEENKLSIKNPSNKFAPEKPVDVLIIDETSMLDISLGASLLKAVPDNCQVIFIGDKDQLPSVGAGNVLHDLLNTEIIKHFKLTKIFRQAQKSKIITYAHEINTGVVPDIPTPVKDNTLFGSEIDCLFIDSDEANQEQLKFIKKAKFALKEVENEGKVKVFLKGEVKNVVHKVAEEVQIYQTIRDLEEDYDTFNVPKKLQNADLRSLVNSQNGAEELKSVLNKIPRYSTLNYGMTASESIVRLVSETLPKNYGQDTEIQILCPMVRGTVGTLNLNKEIQNKINPYAPDKGQIIIGERVIRKNDRVIQNVNNYDLGVFNGDIGKVIAVDSANFACVIEFGQGINRKLITYEKSDLTEISLAYAITIHKSQGSEFPIVVIPILTQHFNMLFRNLIYTGLTRAKKAAIFVGSRKALAISVHNVDMKERQTTLKYLLEN